MYVQPNGIPSTLSIPLAGCSVAAGFPSPAEDYLEESIDLNRALITHPAATFAVRARGDSMRGAGVFSGDLLIVDRAAPAVDGSVVVAVVDGDFTVKRLRYKGGKTFLCPENESFQPIEVTDFETSVWGVVTYSIHRHLPR